ncbi:MAG: hypothetical protein ACOY5B_11615 [Spirochaetota bacterium]
MGCKYRYAKAPMLIAAPNDWGVNLSLLLSDERLPHLGGNKYHKISGYLAEARRQGVQHLLTMAGPHSNHLRAFSAVIAQGEFTGTVLVRGEELNDSARHSEEIRGALHAGVRCIFVTREVYRQLRTARDADTVRQLITVGELPRSVFIPEGGHGPIGTVGVAAWAAQVQDFSDIFIACATGTTCAGFLLDTAVSTRIWGISVVRNESSVMQTISQLAPGHEQRFTLLNEYDQGGFARFGTAHAEFCERLSAEWGLTIDPVYVGKAAAAIADRAQKGFINGRALLVYTYNE